MVCSFRCARDSSSSVGQCCWDIIYEDAGRTDCRPHVLSFACRIPCSSACLASAHALPRRAQPCFVFFDCGSNGWPWPGRGYPGLGDGRDHGWGSCYASRIHARCAERLFSVSRAAQARSKQTNQAAPLASISLKAQSRERPRRRFYRHFRTEQW